MSTIETGDKLARAMAQARAQYDSIKEMVGAYAATLSGDDESAQEAARTRIEEDALSVLVRGGWYSINDPAQDTRTRGLSGGKQGWRVYREADYAPVDHGSYDHLVALTQARWRSARADCVEAFLFQIYGDQWEGFV